MTSQQEGDEALRRYQLERNSGFDIEQYTWSIWYAAKELQDVWNKRRSEFRKRDIDNIVDADLVLKSILQDMKILTRGGNA